MTDQAWSQAKLSDAAVPQSSLFRSVRSIDGKVIWHLIAHRCATLIPAAHRGVWDAWTESTDDDSITATLRADPPAELPGEWILDQSPGVSQGVAAAQAPLAISIPEGDKTADRVIILAEDLVLYAGSVFSFPAKQVVIIARRLIIVPAKPGWLAAGDANALKVTFDTTKPPGAVPKKAGNGDNGAEANWVSQKGGVDAGDGKQGQPGTAGEPGVSGGSVMLCAQVQSLGFAGTSPPQVPELHMRCDGQQGGRGGDGGNGGIGGKGYSSDSKWYDYHGFPSCCNGGKGGDAGLPGAGSAGGGGGFVHVRQLLDNNTLPSGSPYGSVSITSSVRKGTLGTWGQSGQPGDGGKAGYVYITGMALGSFPKQIYGKDGAKGGGDWPAQPVVEHTTDGTGTSLDVNLDAAARATAGLGPFALGLNPAFVQMLVRRLSFEYDVLFASFFDVQSDRGKSAERLRFESSFAWLNALHAALPTGAQYQTPPTGAAAEEAQLKALQDALVADYNAASSQAARKIAQIAFQKLASLGASETPPRPATDSYGQSFNLVPNISFSIRRLAQIAKEVDVVETRRLQLQQTIDQANANGAQAATMVQSFQTYIENIGTSRASARKAVSDAETEILRTGALRDQVQSAISNVATALRDAVNEKAWMSNFSCDSVEKVLSAAASCLMFTPGARGMVLVGNLLSVGSSSFDLFDTVSSVDGSVPKAQFITQFKAIEKGLSDSDAVDAIGKSMGDPTELLLHSVLVQKKQFDALVAKYFPDGAPHELRVAWSVLMTASETLQAALVKHRQALIDQAKVESYYAQSKLAMSQLQAMDQGTTIPAVQTQLLLQMYDESYALQKQQVIRGYLEAIRAIVALKLDRTTITRSLLRLGCWDNVSGALFNEVILPQLEMENDILRKMDDYFNPIRTKFRGNIRREDYPQYFGFRNEQNPDGSTKLVRDEANPMAPFSFFITTSNCFQILGIDPKMHFDVRMYSCQVVLQGARLRDESPSQLVVDLTVRFNGACAVTNGKTTTVTDPETGETHSLAVEYVFETGTISTGSRWIYDRANPELFTLDAEPDRQRPRLIELDALNPGASRPVQTPLAEWQLYWDQSVVDVSNVTSVWIEVDAVYRPLAQMHLAHDGHADAVDGASTAEMAESSAPLVGEVSSKLHSSRRAMETSNLASTIRPLSVGMAPLSFVKVSNSGKYLRSVQLAIDYFSKLDRQDLRSTALSGIQSIFIPNTFEGRTLIRPSATMHFGFLGNTIDDRVNNMDADSPIWKKTMLDYHGDLLGQYYDPINKATRYNNIFTDFRVALGHEAWISSLRNIGSYVNSMPWDETAVLAMLKAIPMGALVIHGEHRDALMKLPPAKQMKYIWDNLDKIRAAEPGFLQSGESAAGSLILLGWHNLIGLGKFMAYTNGDLELVGFNAITTGLHALDGKNGWFLARTKAMKLLGDMLFTNSLLGRHRVLFGDAANCLLGESLMAATHFRWEVHHRALVDKVPVEAVLQTMPASYVSEYKRLGSDWSMVDGFGLPFNLRRIWVGANTDFTKLEIFRVKTVSDDDLAKELKGPDGKMRTMDQIVDAGTKGKYPIISNADQGIVVDGWQVADAFKATINPGDPVSTGQKAGWLSLSSDAMFDAQQRMQKMLALHYSSTDTQKQFSDRLDTAIAAAKTRLSAADPAAWASMTPGEWALAIRSDWGFQREAQAAVKDIFIESIAGQFSSELAKNPAFTHLLPSDLFSFTDGLSRTEISDKLGAVGDGLVDANVRYATVEAAVHDISLPQVLDQITRIDAAVSDAQKAIKAKQDDLEAKKDQLAKHEIEEREAEIKRDQEGLEKLKEKKDEFEDVKERHEQPGKQSDREKEARDRVKRAQDHLLKPK